MENIDIKDFSSVSAVNDTDNILLARSGGSHGKMQLGISGIGYGIFGTVASYAYIEFIKNNNLFTISVIDI